MSAKRPTAPVRSTAVMLALAAALLAGCASGGGPRSQPGSGTGIVISSPGWLNGALAAPEPGSAAPSVPQYAANPVLRSNETWLGTIGLRQQLSESYEVGFGLAVPNLFPGDSMATVAAERSRDLGVGVWLKFDF